MLDLDFCHLLAYWLGEAFQRSGRDSVRHFWCDGVLLPTWEASYAKKSVNDNRAVVMTVFTGVTGQDVYELTLKFGRRALSKYARDLGVGDCLPGPACDDWWDLDIEQRTMWVQLD